MTAFDSTGKRIRSFAIVLPLLFFSISALSGLGSAASLDVSLVTSVRDVTTGEG